SRPHSMCALSPRSASSLSAEAYSATEPPRLLRAVGRDDLEPAAVGILDEVDAHALVHEAHAAHLLMQGACRVHVVHLEGQVRVAPAVDVGLCAAAVPSEFDLEIGFAVADEHVFPRVVLWPHAALHGQAERALVERERRVEV